VGESGKNDNGIIKHREMVYQVEFC